MSQAINVTVTNSAVAKPFFFDGNKGEYGAFKRAIDAYIAANPNEFTDDAKKILFTYSYLTKGDAALWAEVWHSDHLRNGILTPAPDPTTTPPTPGLTWAEFIKELDEQFEDVNIAEKARIDINQIRQGSDTAAVFFNKFERLMTKAGYTSAAHYTVLENIIKHAVNRNLIEKIYATTILPTTYNEWKTRIVKLDNMLRELPKTYIPWRMPPASKQTNERTGNERSPHFQKPVRGEPVPMDVDAAKATAATRKPPTPFTGNCFNCGKPGHRQRALNGTWLCPEPPKKRPPSGRPPARFRTSQSQGEGTSIAPEATSERKSMMDLIKENPPTPEEMQLFAGWAREQGF